MAEPKERPIIMSAESVEAILDGRKTQTRRAIRRIAGKGTVTEFQEADSPRWDQFCFLDCRRQWNGVGLEWLLGHCPYGRIGDRLWVREAFYIGRICEALSDGKSDGTLYVSQCKGDNDFIPAEYCQRNMIDVTESIKKPSVHMPRHASRIMLEITGLRVERLQDISEEDAIAEAPPLKKDRWMLPIVSDYADWWDAINGEKRPWRWSRNPWVWVIEFRKAMKGE